MKNLVNFIIRVIVGMLILFLLEGMFTLGMAFRFEHYNWIGWLIQSMLVLLVICFATFNWDSGKSIFDKKY